MIDILAYWLSLPAVTGLVLAVSAGLVIILGIHLLVVGIVRLCLGRDYC